MGRCRSPARRSALEPPVSAIEEKGAVLWVFIKICQAAAQAAPANCFQIQVSAARIHPNPLKIQVYAGRFHPLSWRAVPAPQSPELPPPPDDGPAHREPPATMPSLLALRALPVLLLLAAAMAAAQQGAYPQPGVDELGGLCSADGTGCAFSCVLIDGKRLCVPERGEGEARCGEMLWTGFARQICFAMRGFAGRRGGMSGAGLGAGSGVAAGSNVCSRLA
jgi:hypothetical protein